MLISSDYLELFTSRWFQQFSLECQFLGLIYIILLHSQHYSYRFVLHFHSNEFPLIVNRLCTAQMNQFVVVRWNRNWAALFFYFSSFLIWWIINRPSGYKCAIMTKRLIKTKKGKRKHQQLIISFRAFILLLVGAIAEWILSFESLLLRLNSFLSFYLEMYNC